MQRNRARISKYHPHWLAGWAAVSLLLLAAWGGCMRATKEMDPPAQEPQQAQSAEAKPKAQPPEVEQPVVTPVAMQQDDAAHPFPRRVAIREFPRESEWVNTGGPIRLHDLRGRFVLLDFWTYCCINCMHVLPELEKLEETYPNNLVVIGVHAAKFEGEEQTENIRDAILRYDIQHPVVNDAQHVIWDSLGISAWPTIVLIDPEGFAVFIDSGEFEAEDIDAIIRRAMPYYRERGVLDETPLQLDVISAAQPERPLRFPGKVLADAPSERLFIADTGHHRIVVTSLAGELQAVIGGGEPGFEDGDFAAARFNDPHGLALVGDMLYVADTGNHAIRRIDLSNHTVETVAGTGEQASGLWPGERAGVEATGPDDWEAPAKETALSSPWALWPAGDDLFIGMAGRHQIWRLRLEEGRVGLYAGNGREDIVDGLLSPSHCYAPGFSSFAQPSGLTSDGEWLYVADSEGSSIRKVPLNGIGQVRTLAGTAELPFNRLFVFGHVDGPAAAARFQHPLGVAWRDGTVYVADTYNDVIRTVDAATGRVDTLPLVNAGEGNSVPQFDEPEGLSIAGDKLYIADTNGHRIVQVVLADDADGLNLVSPVNIEGLVPPEKAPTSRRPDFSDSVLREVEPVQISGGSELPKLAIELTLPEGWKLNSLGPMAYLLEATGPAGDITGEGLAELVRLDTPTQTLEIPLPSAAVNATEVRLSLRYYYCQEGAEGLCRVGAVTWQIPLAASGTGQPVVPLEYFVPAQ